MSGQIHPILVAIEFIEGNLKEKIDVGDIAYAAGYSLYYFIRTFNKAVHHTPYDYLMRRRLSKAAVDLVSDDRPIIEIAVGYQFNNHETFSRAFKRMFSMPPSRWRENGVIPHRSLFPPLIMANLEHIKEKRFSKPELVERKGLSLAGLMTKDKTDFLELTSILDNLIGKPQNSEPQKPQGDEKYWVSSFSDTHNKNTLHFLGVSISSDRTFPPPVVIQTFPSGHYVQVKHYGKWETAHLTLDYIYHTWMEKTGRKKSHPFEVVLLSDENLISGNELTNITIYIPIRLMDEINVL